MAPFPRKKIVFVTLGLRETKRILQWQTCERNAQFQVIYLTLPVKHLSFRINSHIWRCMLKHAKRQVNNYIRLLQVFITVVCVLFHSTTSLWKLVKSQDSLRCISSHSRNNAAVRNYMKISSFADLISKNSSSVRVILRIWTFFF